MGKSKVSVREVADTKVEDMCENCLARRVELVKTTTEHNSYVRKEDYFNRTNEDMQVDPNPDASIANASYRTATGPDVLTPPVNRYFYDKNTWNINPKVQ